MRPIMGNFTGANMETTAQRATEESRNFRVTNAVTDIQRTSRRRHRDFAAERLAARERERLLREGEDARIRQMNEQIDNLVHRKRNMQEEISALEEANLPEYAEVLESMNEQLQNLENTIEMFSTRLTFQTAQIQAMRMEREQSAIERELLLQQQEMEERMRERERIARENQENRLANKSDEELEEAAERSAIRNLTTMSARMDNISGLRSTRAALSAEATRLEAEGRFDMTRQAIANSEIIAHARQTGADPGLLFTRNPLAEDGFRGHHLQNLQEGISRTTTIINHQIGALYRDSQNMQEEQLRIYRERARVPSEDDQQNDEQENNSIDLRL